MVEFDTPGGAEYYKADLHIHTPGSYDYQDAEAEPSDLVVAFEREKPRSGRSYGSQHYGVFRYSP